MPIGKNAIKRVENNGYSHVETQAPDMENSTVIANVDEQVEEVILAPVEKTTGKKSAKKPASKKSSPKKESKGRYSRVEVGEEMPYFLL